MLPTTWVAALPLQVVEIEGLGQLDLVANVVGSAVGAFVGTTVVGAILVAIAPAYVERQVDAVRDEPVGSFVYGFIWLVLLVVLSIALVLTIVGIIVVIPLLLLASLTWAVGSAIAFLAIANALVDHDNGWAVPLLVAGALSGGLTLTGIGGLVAFGVGAAGFGVVLRDYVG